MQGRVVQWCIGYLAAGWVVLQVVSMLSDTYGWPAWVTRSTPVLIATGLVVTAIVAWYHGARGSQKMRATEIILIATTLGCGIGASWWISRDRGTPRNDVARNAVDPIRIAVLPFENLGGGNADLADAISDEIRGKLTTLQGVAVIARTSSNAFRNSDKTLAQIAGELDVEYLLTGTVRVQPATDASPARMRVSPELIQAVDRRSAPVSKWQDVIDEDVTDAFAVQSTIAQRVAAGMHVALAAGDKARFARKPTDNQEAWIKFLQARRVAGVAFQQAEPYVKAVALTRGALALDPDFAEAWSQLATQAGLAQWFIDRANPDGEYYKISMEAAAEAMRLSPDLYGPVAEGNFLLFAKTDYKAARDRFQATLGQAPSNEELLVGICGADEFLVDWAAAADDCPRAAALDPLNPNAHARSAVSLAVMGRFEEAERHSARLQELAAESGDADEIASAHVIDVRLRRYKGDVRGVRERLDRAAADSTIAEAVLARGYNQYWWLYTEALQRRALEVVIPGTYPLQAPGIRAQAHYALGDSARAKSAAIEARRHLVAQFERSWAGSPTVAMRRAYLAALYMIEGDAASARREAERCLREMPLLLDGINAASAHREVAWVFLQLGDTAQSLKVLDNVLATRQIVTRADVRSDPRFAALRSRPEFMRMTAER